MVGELVALGLLFTPVLVYFVASLILGPIDRVAKTHNAPLRFRIIDFFCLVVELQIAFGLAVQFDEPRERFIVGGLGTSLAVVMWFAGVRTLSKAEIEDSRRRAAFNWFVLPFSYIGILAVAPLVLSLFGYSTTIPVWHLLTAMGVPPGLVLCGVLARWIASGAAQVDKSSTETENPPA